MPCPHKLLFAELLLYTFVFYLVFYLRKIFKSEPVVLLALAQQQTHCQAEEIRIL